MGRFGLHFDNLFVFLGYGASLFGFTFSLPKFIACHMLAKARGLMTKQMRAFDVRAAKCFDEADRAFVETCIVDWFGCVDAFNRTVRKELIDTLEHSMGCSY